MVVHNGEHEGCQQSQEGICKNTQASNKIVTTKADSKYSTSQLVYDMT